MFIILHSIPNLLVWEQVYKTKQVAHLIIGQPENF